MINLEGHITGRKAFWIAVEESFLWEPCIAAMMNKKIRVTGRPVGSKVQSLNPYGYDMEKNKGDS